MYGLALTQDEIRHATQRAYLRGFLLERKQGTALADYELPKRIYQVNPNLPHFITSAFWQELRHRVFNEFDA